MNQLKIFLKSILFLLIGTGVVFLAVPFVSLLCYVAFIYYQLKFWFEFGRDKSTYIKK